MKRLVQIGSCCALWFLLFNVPILIGADTVQQLVETFKKPIPPSQPLLGADLTVKETFEPGAEAAIGLIELVQGEGYIIHQKSKTAFKAAKDVALFQGDTLITGQQGRIQARLDDKSTFALAEQSKLILTKVFYKSATNERNSEINLTDGRARFKVVKAAEGSQYKVTTPTAVAGIRGSDFALMVVPANQQAAALSAGQRLASLFQVRSAYALIAALPTTALITGEETTITFTGLSGAAQSVGPLSLASAAGQAASSAVIIGTNAAMGVLESVGPNLAYMAMPAQML